MSTIATRALQHLKPVRSALQNSCSFRPLKFLWRVFVKTACNHLWMEASIHGSTSLYKYTLSINRQCTNIYVSKLGRLPPWLWQPRWNLGFGQWWEMLTSRTSLKSSRRILRPSSHSMKHSILNTNTTNMSFDLSATLTLTEGAVHGTVELRGQHRPSEAPGGGQSEKDKGHVQKGEHLGSAIVCRGVQKCETYCCINIGIGSGFVGEWADTLASQRIVKIHHEHECHGNTGNLLLTLSFLPLVIPHFDLFFGSAHQVGDHVKCFVIDAHRPVLFTGLQEICRDGQEQTQKLAICGTRSSTWNQTTEFAQFAPNASESEIKKRMRSSRELLSNFVCFCFMLCFRG